jgi:hypothetical protein
MLVLRIAGYKYGSGPSTDVCGDIINNGVTKENPGSQLPTMVTNNSPK